MKARLFISYCRTDAHDLRLLALLDALKRATRGAHEIVVDSDHADARVGNDLDEFMALIDTSDAVLLLLSPSYRSRVVDRSNTGVYNEFQRIYARFQAVESGDAASAPFLLLPFILSGTFDNACPPELRRVICDDLSWLHVLPKNGTFVVGKSVRARLRQWAHMIVNRVSAIAATKRAAYRAEREELFRGFLFDDTKSRWDKPENEQYLKTAFVKTSTFLRVRNREVSFIVGRKGAGKSTITHVLPRLARPEPDAVLRVDFEDVPLDMCFNILQARPGAASDLKNAFSPIYSYELLWDCFLHLYLAWTFRRELPQRSTLRALLRRLAPDTSGVPDLERSGTATRALFVYAFEQLIEFVDSVMKRPHASGRLAESVADYTRYRFREHVFGSSWKYVDQILERNSGHKILITVDGFDVLVDYFSRENTDPAGAAKFESLLLLALFQIVLKGRRAHAPGSTLYGISDFCIAIPHDRFLQVRALDRDRYQYRQYFAPVAWTGIELSSLVRKRLALMRKVEDHKGPSLEQRLGFVMRAYPELPDEVTFQFGSANYRIPLFIYVLRHTFWRPRDVLFFYAALLAAAQQFKKKGTSMPAPFVRQIVANSTRAIIEDEFLSEYSFSFRNLRSVLSHFREGKQVLSWQILDKTLSPLRFDVPVRTGDVPTLEWKVELLYDLGVLGVVLDRDRADRLSAFRHAFNFNEGDLLREKIGRDLYPSHTFAVHPVFCEYLLLDTTSNSELILPMTWKYLHDNEVLRRGLPA